MAETMCIELRLVVDRVGGFGIGRDGETASEDYDNREGGDRTAMREFRITLTVPLPEIEDISGDVPAITPAPVKLCMANA